MNTPVRTLLDFLYDGATNEHKHILCHALRYFRDDLHRELMASPPFDSDQRKLVVDQWIDRLKTIVAALKKFPNFKESKKGNTSRSSRMRMGSSRDGVYSIWPQSSILVTPAECVAGQLSLIAPYICTALAGFHNAVFLILS